MRSDIKLSPLEYEYALSAHAQQCQALLALIKVLNPKAFWLSEWRKVREAELKPLQRRAAKRAGFKNLLPTLYTSSADEAKRFVKKHGQCVVKTISLIMPSGYNQPTTIIDDTFDWDGLYLAPQIFQPLIVPKAEVRVATIGTQVFASEVKDTDTSPSRVRDFRLAPYKGTFEAKPYSLPPEVEAACIAYLKEFDISTGFSDLLVDDQDRYWFLETNPIGEWGFMDKKAREGIARAHAKLLDW